jgi:hypothetical protein
MLSKSKWRKEQSKIGSQSQVFASNYRKCNAYVTNLANVGIQFY